MLVDRIRKSDVFIIGLSMILFILALIAFLLKPDSASNLLLINSSFGLDFNQIGRVWIGFLNLILAINVALWSNRVCEKLGLLGEISNLPILTSAIYFGLVPLKVQSPLVYAYAILVLIVINKTYTFFELNLLLRKNIFAAAFSCGVLTLLEPKLVGFGLLPLAVLIISGKFNVKLMLIWLIAILLPWYFAFSFWYIFSLDVPFDVLKAARIEFVQIDFKEDFLPLLVMVILVLILVIVTLSRGSTSLVNRQRANLIALISLIGLSPTLFASLNSAILLCYVPATILLARFFVKRYPWYIKDSFFIILLILFSLNLWI